MGPANGHLVRASPVAVTHAEPLCHEVGVEMIDDNDHGGDDGDHHIGDDGDLKIISDRLFMTNGDFSGA